MSADAAPDGQSQEIRPIERVEVLGLFDSAAAHALRERVSRLRARATVLLDLSHVEGIRDSALQTIAELMNTDSRQCVIVRGLGHHQELILRYLGMGLAGAPAEASARQPVPA